MIISTREHLYDLKSLENFTYHDEHNRDQGINSRLSFRFRRFARSFVVVRHKVKELVGFVQDDGRIRDERKRAKATRDKYVGMSNEAASYRYAEDSYSSKKSDFRKTRDQR